MARTVTSKPQPDSLLLGYAQTKEQEADLMAYGVQRIWLKGRGAESLAHCLQAFRDRKGRLTIAADLRVLCNKPEPRRPDIVAALAAMERRGILVLDVRYQHETHAQLQDRAFKAVANARFTTNKRKAKREGAKGGLAKGIAAQARRNARVADDIVERLCSLEKLTWKECAWVLGGGFSAASLNRQFHNL